MSNVERLLSQSALSRCSGLLWHFQLAPPYPRNKQV